jgi:hypothetical protein
MKHFGAKFCWGLFIVFATVSLAFFVFLTVEAIKFGEKAFYIPLIPLDCAMVVGLIGTLREGWRVAMGVPPEPAEAPLLPSGPSEIELRV